MHTCCQEHIIMNPNCSCDDTAKAHAWKDITIVGLHGKSEAPEPTNPQQYSLEL